MSKDRRIYSYSITKTDSDEPISQEEINERLGEIQGVINIALDLEALKIDYEIDEWASEYDVLSAVMEIIENYGLALKFDNEEIEKISAEEHIAENDAEAEEKDKKRSRFADFAEKVIVLSIAVILTVIGVCLGVNKNASMWLFMIAYAFAAYEILFGVITEIIEKKYLFEEVLVLVSTLIMLYLGYRATACVVMIAYSGLSVLNFTFQDFILKKIDALKSEDQSENASENVSDKLALYEKLLAENSSDEAFILKNRFKFHVALAILGVLVSFIPPLFHISSYGATLTNKWLPIGVWILAFAIISPLYRSIKSTYYFGMNKLINNGVYPKDAESLKSLSDIDEAVFDKTGVLNLGRAEIVDYKSDRDNFIKIVNSALINGNHPISIAVREKCNPEELFTATDFKEIQNRGISCKINGKNYILGNKKLLAENGVETDEYSGENSPLYVAENGVQIGVVLVKYTITDNAFGAVTELSEDTLIKPTLISSDGLSTVDFYKKQLGLSKAIASASTDYKISYVNKGKKVYVGNKDADSEVLEKANTSVSLGGYNDNSKFSVIGSDVKEVPSLLKICKRTAKILSLNLKLSLCVKALCIALGIVLMSTANINIFIWLFIADFVIQTLTLLLSLKNSTDPV